MVSPYVQLFRDAPEAHLAHLVRSETPDISISCLDRFDGLEEILTVEGYQYAGSGYRGVGRTYVTGDLISLDDELPGENILRDCVPVYRKLNGWENSRNLSVGSDLDSNITRFISYIEDKTNCNVISFGNGAETSDIVFIEKYK